MLQGRMMVDRFQVLHYQTLSLLIFASLSYLFMENFRKLLTTYACNILGSYEDAKDIVQDAYLKLSGVNMEAISGKVRVMKFILG